MFRTAKHILAIAVAIGTAAVPSTALADTAPASNSAPTVSQIIVTKTVDASSARRVQTSGARLVVRKAGKDQLQDL
jgi:hypothetical protein